MLPSLVTLRQFLTVLDSGTLRQASVVLNIAQPALTRRIQKLEEDIGVPLLVRHTHGITPTEAGLVLRDWASRLLSLSAQMEAEVRATAAAPTGSIRLGFPASVAMSLIGKAIPEFLLRFPNVTFYLTEGNSRVVQELLLKDKLDMAIVSLPKDHPDIDIVPLYTEAFWLIGRPEDWTFKSESISFEQLKGLPLIVSKYAMDAKDLHLSDLPQTPVVEVDAIASIHPLVRAGAGYYLGLPSSLWQELRRSEFVGAPVMDIQISRSMIRRKNRPPTKAVTEFTRQIVAVTKTTIEANEMPWALAE